MSVGNIIMFSEAEDRQEDNDVENIRYSYPTTWTTKAGANNNLFIFSESIWMICICSKAVRMNKAKRRLQDMDW